MRRSCSQRGAPGEVSALGEKEGGGVVRVRVRGEPNAARSRIVAGWREEVEERSARWVARSLLFPFPRTLLLFGARRRASLGARPPARPPRSSFAALEASRATRGGTQVAARRRAHSAPR